MAAVKIDEQHCSGAAPQVRVVQGKEPGHFVQLWDGKMVVYKGGVASGFRTVHDEEEGSDESAPRLFHVKGDSTVPPYAVQVEAIAASLNSGDAFVLLTPTHAYVWAGGACLTEEKAAAAAIAKFHLVGSTDRTVVQCAEGEEADGFWEALGGRSEYCTTPAVEAEHPPRLFVLNDAATGGHSVSSDEILHFSQADLLSEDVAILDTGAALYVWLGAGASENEKSEAQKVAERYLSASERSTDTPVTIVKEGSEPPMFTAHFHGWSHEHKHSNAADYDARVQSLKASNPPPSKPAANGKTAASDSLDLPTAADMAKPASLDLPTAADEKPNGASKAANGTASTPGKTAATRAQDDKVNGAKEPAAEDSSEEPEVETSAVEEVTDQMEEVEIPDEPAKDASEPDATDTPSRAPKLDVEQLKLPSVADTVKASQNKEEAATSTATPPLPTAAVKSTVTGVPARSLTAQTPRGAEYAPEMKDPSGTKGEGLKHPPGSTAFELATLKEMKGSDGIDPTVKEKYLADDAFQEVFGMDKDAFAKQPLWRRQQHKKKVGLF